MAVDEPSVADYGQPEYEDSGADLDVGRSLPHNMEAEQGVLGGLLLAPERWDLVEGRLSPEDFYNPAYGSIFEAITSICNQSQPIDLLVLKDELVRRKQFDAVGGNAGLAALTDAVPTGAHVEYYAQIVKEKAMLRRLIKASTEIVELATTNKDTATEIMDHAERSIFEVTTSSVSGEASSIGNVLKETWEKIEKFQAMGGAGGVTGIPTYFNELNEMTTGLHPDELIIVAARPAMGKSTFTLNLLRHMAVDYNEPVVLYSLEMSAENIVRNMLAAQGKVNAQSLRKMTPTQEELSKLVMASDTLSQAPIFIDDTPAISLSELRGKTRRLKARHGVKACFIDYLQLMTASSIARNRSREQEVSEISRGLKALAKELQIPVVALSQLSRKSEGRTENRPILSDLRESGAIEQDADMVLLLHRPDYYDPEDSPGECEVIIAKQRNGPTGTVNLTFINNQLRFENLSLRSDEGYVPSGGEEEM
ncbi:MAG: replicative DNA helicase [Planctomycetes bacterium]|nr:replicative DNA helicase [Planctomycetota bacterium]